MRVRGREREERVDEKEARKNGEEKQKGLNAAILIFTRVHHLT
jgi:hypothetical protein